MRYKPPQRLPKPQLKDLNGLRVCLILPPSAEAQLLSSHLVRIGCVPVISWPIPKTLPEKIDFGIVIVEPDYRVEMSALAQSLHELSPPLIAIVEYEDPSTLQLVLEVRAEAVIQRPIKPFGLLTNLMIARANWQLRAEAAANFINLEKKQLVLSKIETARVLIKQQCKMSDEEAHRRMQKLAMNTRCSLEVIAEKIITDKAPTGLLALLNDTPVKHK